MKRFALAAAALCVAGDLAAQAPSPTPAPTPPPITAIRAARMFDGRSDTTIANAVVLVQGGQILGAGAGPRRAGRARRSSTSATRRSCPASSTRTRT